MPYHTNSNNTRSTSPSTRLENSLSPQVTSITGSAITSSIDSIILNDKMTSNITIDRNFGSPDDYIELHIFNTNNVRIYSEPDFNDFSFPSNSPDTTVNEIEINPEQILRDRGFISGEYRLKLNILKNRIFNTPTFPFQIKTISSDRREISSIALDSTNNTLVPAVNSFISTIQSSPYFTEYGLNFGEDIIIPAINIRLDKDPTKNEVLFRLLQPLSPSFSQINNFKIVEEISDPIIVDINLGITIEEDTGIPLSEPNFQIDIRQNNSIPSGFKSYNDILNYNLTSSFQELLHKLENDSLNLNTDYTHIRSTHSSSIEETFHFENFIHFGSAVNRLKNFKEKIKLIEKYDTEIGQINNIPGGATTTTAISNINRTNNKKEKLIKNFDGYEHFLYFTSGTYAWPKQNTTQPYTLYPISSSEFLNWFGNEDSYFGNYGGQLLSASLFDRQNPYSLNKVIPSHITDNINNAPYLKFIDMVGQHFDSIWTYIKSITSIHDSNHIKGISKDLAYYQLKGLGIEAFDQFENSNLIEYILGVPSGSQTYGATNISSSGFPFESVVTASNSPSIPKGDIAKEIWKRLYHNAPYLLKTKGTERGIRGLMSCYGVPPSILNIKEYGGSTTVTGPLKDISYANHYKTFSYQKSGIALKGSSGANGFFIKTNWSSSLTDALSSSAKTVEFRIKPTKASDDSSYMLFALRGDFSAQNNKNPQLVLRTYQGNDLFETNDASKYAKLDLLIGGSVVASTDNFPAYNGDFWNIFIGTDFVREGIDHTGASSIRFGAYQSNFLKNIFKFTATYSEQSPADRQVTFGDPYHGNKNLGGTTHAYFGGGADFSSLEYEGYLQEIKFHYHESSSITMLSDATLKKHALEPFMYAGNHPSSSFKEVVLRLPLGSNDLENSSSFHPNDSINYLGTEEAISGSVEETYVSSSMATQEWEEIIETHHLPTPDTVGISMTSEKVRIDEGTIDDNILSVVEKKETSTLDRQPQDFEDLGIHFSPTNEINEDIIYTLGSFRLDDHIGDPLPSAQSSSVYKDLKEIKDIYFQKVKNRYNYWAYIKQIQYIDHTLFKIIEQFVPFKSNTKTGLLIEPHFLERTKIPRTHNPLRSDAQTMTPGLHQKFDINISTGYGNNKLYEIAPSNADDFGTAKNIKGQWDPGSYVIGHNNFHKFLTSSKGGAHRQEQGTNTTIRIYDDYMDPTDTDPNRENQQSSQAPVKPFNPTIGKPLNYIAHESSVLLGNAVEGRKSNRYYIYKQYYMKSSSLY
tara:strand:- start:5746 stop:9522 length:3777 start_codon:yes stop_codon:yes gene_type:complete